MLFRGEPIPATAAAVPQTKPFKINGHRRNIQKNRNLINNDNAAVGASAAHRHHSVRSTSFRTTTQATLGHSSNFSRASIFRNPAKKNALPVMSTLFLAFTSLAFLLPSSTSRLFRTSTTTRNARTYSNNVDRGAGLVQSEVDVRIAVVAPLNEKSPLGPDWGTVLPHIAERIAWSDPGLQLRVINASTLQTQHQDGNPTSPAFGGPFIGVDAVLALDIKNEAVARNIRSKTGNINTFTALGSLDSLTEAARMAGVPVSATDSSKLNGISGLIASIQALVSPSARTAQRQSHAFATMRELYSRSTSDDLLFSFLVLVNEASRPVAAVSNSTKRSDAGMDAVNCMVSNCAKEMFDCFTDSVCRTALDCMNACAFNDQVCSYRCIASYESPQLQQFSLCIIQKHNCLGLAAEIPSYPNPAPMKSFQGKALTHELAEGLFVGWLDGAQTAIDRTPLLVAESNSGSVDSGSSTNINGGRQNMQEKQLQRKLDPFSWRVFAGKNPAYDYFPCQFQLFYPGKAKSSFWYQPVFKVITIDGQKVWRQRLYRVRRDKTPGRFFLSVLDNGVTSLEQWSIIDCDEGLDWCIFYYRGAASAAGMSYTGAVLASRSGDWPADSKSLERIEVGLDKAGIKMWELSTVSNAECDDPPLNLIGPPAAAA